MTFRPDPEEWENKKMTEVSEDGYVRLKTLDKLKLNYPDVYKEYKVFLAHYRAFNRLAKFEDALTLRKQEDWHEYYGDCIWFRKNKEFFEPVYIGKPLDTEFPEDKAEFFIKIPMLFVEDLKEVEE